jgi:hypothetical protein
LWRLHNLAIAKGHYYGAYQRNSEACKNRKFLREDKIEQAIVEMLEQLVCPTPEIIQWVADQVIAQNVVETKKLIGGRK